MAVTLPLSGSKNCVATVDQPPRSAIVNRPAGVGKSWPPVSAVLDSGRYPFSSKIFWA
jgi:hypothetical protein